MVVFTSICLNYLPKALVLGKSLKKTNHDIKYYIVLLEREVPKEWKLKINEVADEIILAKDLGFHDFDKFIFKHSIVEASTSVKGRALVYLLEKGFDKVVYLDPDIKVYGSLSELSHLLDEHEIILTPHLTIPENSEEDIRNNELCALQHGVYNLGFVAVSNRSEGFLFAKWWKDRLELYCYDDIPNGIFTDQRWCDLAPAYFDVYILKDVGYNMAPWNLSKRTVELKDDKLIVNQTHELIFFHYSGFDSGANEEMLQHYVPDKKNHLYSLKKKYINELNECGQELLGKALWSYDTYLSGEKIEKDVRKFYRDIKYFNEIDVNPFHLSNNHLKELMKMNGEEKKPTFFKRVARKIIPISLRKKIKTLLKR